MGPNTSSYCNGVPNYMLVILVIIMNLLTGNTEQRLTNPHQQMCEPANSVLQIIRLFNELGLVIKKSEGAILPHLEDDKCAHLPTQCVEGAMILYVQVRSMGGLRWTAQCNDLKAFNRYYYKQGGSFY